MTKTTLLLIDCQRSFHSGGSLAVPKADEDAERIASFIKGTIEGGEVEIDRIVCTMDSHHTLDIAHPGFWLKGSDFENGGIRTHPDPFTIISCQDVENGDWIPSPHMKDCDKLVDPTYFKGGRNKDGSFDLRIYCIDYTRALEDSGKFKLCIWPEHCLIGSSGHALVECIHDAIGEWEMSTGKSVEFVHKGQNLLSEMYSALKAEVPISEGTAFNENFFHNLRASNKILIAGEASSHCVNFTTRDLVEKWPEKERSNILILTDCASPVPGFEEAATSFHDDMKALGVGLCTVAEVANNEN